MYFGTTISSGATATNADKFVWTPSGGVKINGSVSEQTLAGNVNISASASGQYTVKAYSTICQAASSNSIVKKIYYGAPVINSATVNGGPQLVPNIVPNGASLVLNMAPGQYSYNWGITNGTGFLNPETNSANATPNPFIRVEGIANNACGFSSTAFYLSSQQQFFTVSPNPANNGLLTIRFENELYKKELLKSITLFDERQNPVMKYVPESLSESSDEVVLDISKIGAGQYFLMVDTGNNPVMQTVLVQ